MSRSAVSTCRPVTIERGERPHRPWWRGHVPATDVAYDVIVIGASLGGVASALRAAAMGASVCLLEATDWVGGQYTSQGVTKPDENAYIDTGGNSSSR